MAIEHQWKPGQTPYATFLSNLKNNDPAGYERHLLERKQRKMIKNAMREVVNAQQAQWITLFHNGALKLLDKAVENGDAQAYGVLYDRIIGKPTETINTETDLVLPWNDDVAPTTTNDDDDDDEDAAK